MPSIPVYNQEATDDLNRAKRRVVEAEKAGIARLTTKPAVDETNGKADDLADKLIRLLENFIDGIENQLYLEGVTMTDFNTQVLVETTKNTILLTRQTRRILANAEAFARVIQFADLEKITTIKSLLEELGNPDENGTLTNRLFIVIRNKILIALENMDAEARSQYSRATDSVISELSSVLGDDDEDDDTLGLEDDVSYTWSEIDRRRENMMRRREIRGEMDNIQNLLSDLARDMARNRERERDEDDDESSFGSTLNPASLASRESRERRRIDAQTKSFQKEDYMNIVKKMYDNLVDIFKVFNKAFYNFNQFRQQQLPPDEEQARDADQAEVFEGRGRFKLPDRKKVYSVGNKVLDAMYAIEGLPKFL